MTSKIYLKVKEYFEKETWIIATHQSLVQQLQIYIYIYKTFLSH